jgi:hypothetical protein
MLNFRDETTLTLNQAARLLPPSRRGRPVTLSCVLRWVLQGVRTPAGTVRLEAVRLGGRWLTSLEALERFAAAQTPQVDGSAPPTPRAVAAKRRAAERAGALLEKVGA